MDNTNSNQHYFNDFNQGHYHNYQNNFNSVDNPKNLSINSPYSEYYNINNSNPHQSSLYHPSNNIMIQNNNFSIANNNNHYLNNDINLDNYAIPNMNNNFNDNRNLPNLFTTFQADEINKISLTNNNVGNIEHINKSNINNNYTNIVNMNFNKTSSIVFNNNDYLEEINNIADYRGSIFKCSDDFREKNNQRVESRFNELRKKMRQKVFENKLNTSIENLDGINCKSLGEINAFQTIKNYINEGIFDEDFYNFDNFDHRTDVSCCKFCGSYVFLIDKQFILCSSDCFSFTLNPDCLKYFNLDNLLNLFFQACKEHSNCKSKIIYSDCGDGDFYFSCSKCSEE